MSQLVHDCPRCGAKKTTFDVRAHNRTAFRYDWQNWFEAFAICRHCSRGTIFRLSQRDAGEPYRSFFAQHGPSKMDRSVNDWMDVEGYISISDHAAIEPPEFLPENIKAVFVEGAKCVTTNCYNAAGTMFRLCVDLATLAKLPEGEPAGLNAKVRRDLGLRLPWLFDSKLLPEDLRELSSAVKEDGNDGAHKGTLKKEDAADLLDFAYALLERLYTEPERIRLAKARRDERRKT